MADAREFNDRWSRPTGTHCRRGSGSEEVRFGTPQHQRRAGDRVPKRPQIAALAACGAKRHADPGVELESPAAIGFLSRGTSRQCFPLILGKCAKRRRHLADVRLQLIKRIESGVETYIRSDARKRSRLDDRADIVDHQPDNRRFRLCRHHYAEQSSHGGADPCDAVRTGVGKQGRQRGEIGRKSIIVGIAQPLAVAASRHIRTDHSITVGNRRSQGVEIASVTGQAMNADDDVRIFRVAPLAVDDSMKTVCAEALEMVFAGKGHAWLRGQKNAVAAAAHRRGKRARRQ